MEYSVEEISPVKKTISVTIPVEEVNGSLAAALHLLVDSVQLDGFRKGKVPLPLIKKKFHERINNEAKDNLVNVHINEILTAQQDTPLDGIVMDFPVADLEEGKDFHYTMTYEIMPKFDLPNYEGLEVEQKKAVISEKALQEITDKMRNEFAEFVPVDGNGPVRDGEIAVVDFEGFDDDGKPVDGVKATNFSLEIGNGQSLKEFEDLVKGIPLGHTSEGKITFPADFLNQDLAGKTLTMKVTLNAIKKKILPELNEEFAKRMGRKTVDELKEVIQKSYLATAEDLYKSEAQYNLLQQLLKQVEFQIPESLIRLETSTLINDFIGRMERQGLSIKAINPDMDKMAENLKPRATDLARNQIILNAIAKKENLSITDEELIKELYQSCQRNGEDFNEVLTGLQESGFISHIRNKMLADKAMDLVYSKAKVTFTDNGSKIDTPEAQEEIVEDTMEEVYSSTQDEA